MKLRGKNRVTESLSKAATLAIATLRR